MVAVYVSLPVELLKYNQLPDCACVARFAGVGTKNAHVQPVAVPAVISAVVAISTLPATVSLAFGCVDHAAKAFHAQAIY